MLQLLFSMCPKIQIVYKLESEKNGSFVIASVAVALKKVDSNKREDSIIWN